jgi:hypothetical protein
MTVMLTVVAYVLPCTLQVAEESVFLFRTNRNAKVALSPSAICSFDLLMKMLLFKFLLSFKTHTVPNGHRICSALFLLI